MSPWIGPRGCGTPPPGNHCAYSTYPPDPGDAGVLNAAALSPDSKLVAVGGMPIRRGGPAARIYLISLESGQVVRALEGQPGAIISLAFSADGAPAGHGKRRRRGTNLPRRYW